MSPVTTKVSLLLLILTLSSTLLPPTEGGKNWWEAESEVRDEAYEEEPLDPDPTLTHPDSNQNPVNSQTQSQTIYAQNQNHHSNPKNPLPPNQQHRYHHAEQLHNSENFEAIDYPTESLGHGPGSELTGQILPVPTMPPNQGPLTMKPKSSQGPGPIQAQTPRPSQAPKLYTQILFPPPTFIQDLKRRSRTSKKGTTSAIPVGDICDPTDPVYSKCVNNAGCVLFEGENLYRCNCSYTYEATSTKKCLRSWGQYCDPRDPCNPESFLTCVNNKCSCENSEVYQVGVDGCRSKVGGPCGQTGGPECVANAVCLSFDRFGRQSRCICKEGYVETSLGLCSSGVGMPCHGKGECNQEIPLVCKKGICSCRESVHIYDPETNSCVGLVGSQCCPNLDGFDCPQNVTNGCVSGAFCKKTSRKMPGRCVCQSYNLESDDRTCTPNPTFSQMVSG